MHCLMSTSFLISADWKPQAVDPVMIRKLLLQLADCTSLSEPLEEPSWTDILCCAGWTLSGVDTVGNTNTIQLEGKN